MVSGTVPKPTQVFENRIKVPKPDLNDLVSADWPKTIESYLVDNVGYRTQVIAWYMKIWETIFGTNVRYFVKGKDEEYYPNHQRAPTVKNYLGLNKISDDTLNSLKLITAGTQAFWELNGVHCLMVMAPDKVSLYPEKLPNTLSKLKNNSNADQISTIFDNSPVQIIDLRGELNTNKSSKKKFNRKFDLLHWNGHGLEVAYKTILKKLPLELNINKEINNTYEIVNLEKSVGIFGSESVPWMRLLKVDNLEVKPNSYSVKTKLPWAKPDLIYNKAISSGKLLLLSDSYIKATHQDQITGANGNIFPLAHHFEYTLNMHYSYLNYNMMLEVLRKFKPDIVIYVFAERATPWAPTFVNTNNHYLQALGELYLGNSALMLTSVNNINEYVVPNQQKKIFTDENTGAFHFDEKTSHLDFLPKRPGLDGKIVVIAKIESQINTEISLFYSQSNEYADYSEKPPVKQRIVKGINYIHLPVLTEFSKPIRLRLCLGNNTSKISFLPYHEMNQLGGLRRGL